MKNKILRTIFAVISAFSLLICASCNNFGGMDSLLEPPKLTATQQEIRNALEKALGKEISFSYPIAGKNKTAITMHDIYGDENNEAVVLYRIGNESADTRVHILTVGQTGTWETLCDIAPESGNSIDRIDFAQIKQTGYDQLLIGWRLFSGNVMSVYDVLSGSAETLVSMPYSEITAANLDSDGDSELVVFTANTETGQTDVKAYNFGAAPEGGAYVFNDGAATQMYLMAETAIKGVTSYLQVLYTKLSDNIPAIVIDAQVSANTYFTEMLCYSNNQLISAFSGEPAIRTVKITSRDIDGDGFVEIPIANLMYGYETAAATDRISSIAWYTYQSNFTGTTNYTSVYNSTWNYMLTFKSSWIKDVSIESVKNPAQWTFCHYDFEMNAFGDRIMTVNAWIDSDWENKKNLYPNQVEFFTRGNTVFTVEIYNFNEITVNELQALFSA